LQAATLAQILLQYNLLAVLVDVPILRTPSCAGVG
jgi:hypothetical protein